MVTSKSRLIIGQEQSLPVTRQPPSFSNDVLAQLAGEPLVVSGFRAFPIPRAGCVYLPIGFGSCMLDLGRLGQDGGVSFLPFRFPCIEGEVDLICLKLHVSIQDNYQKPCSKFYRLLSATSYNFPDLIFAPYVSSISPSPTLHLH